MDTTKADALFIHDKRGRIFRQRIEHVPRAGDLIRLGGPKKETYFKVDGVVWCFDEDDSLGQRVNIGLSSADV